MLCPRPGGVKASVPFHKTATAQSGAVVTVSVPVSVCLTVKTVVDSVDNVVGGRGGDSESALILLDQILFCAGKSLDIVQVTNGLVGSVRGNFSGDSGVKTGHLKVNSDISVVDIDDGSSSQKSNGGVITVGLGFGGKGGESGNSQGGGGRGDEFTAIGGEFGGWSGDLSVGRKGGNRAIDLLNRMERKRMN